MDMIVKQDTQQQADRIFSEALDLPVDDRESFLEDSCGEDLDLRREVDLLLEQYGSTEQALSSTDPSHTLTAGEPEEGGIAAPGAGDLLGNFRLLERLETPSGDRFLAEAEGSRERVVLEVLGPELDNNDVRRIRVEAETITRLEHPGLLSLLEMGTAILGTGPRAFVVTTATDHQDLSTWIAERTPTVTSRVKLAVRLVEATAFGHGRGILDGDLHPGRVLVDDVGRPMIWAMGLPRLLRTHVVPPPDGLSCRAPELVDTPWSRLDVRIDIFALGGMMEWLFRDDLDRDDRITSQLRHIIGRAHAHDPDTRYGSADAMLADLRQLEEAPEESVTAPLLEDVRDFVRRHPRASLAAGVICGLLVATVATLIAVMA
ncbi:MAG: hypothetical protein MK116_10275 [Phycisphaerales bacterium]|nr:hypothetical protein [Phycisphaerales bacterium]